MIKAAVDGREIDFNVDDWGEPSPEAVARLGKVTDEGKNLSEQFETVEDLMKKL